jgi:endonuclease YncB( thermonuclease family)
MGISNNAARTTLGFGFAVFLLLIVGTTNAGAADLVGVPRIIDGDTVEISGIKVRLEGIDAPETDQVCLDDKSQPRECGKGVRYQLIQKSAGRSWTCHVSGQDIYRRSLASCYIDGEDIQRWMVRSGYALSFKRYSHTYDADEAAAREAHAGLWSGAFVAPWDWRSRNKSTEILGAVSVPIDAQKVLLRADSRQTLAEPATSTPAVGPTQKRTAHKATGRCRSASDTAANGSRCGKRAASERRHKK